MGMYIVMHGYLTSFATTVLNMFRGIIMLDTEQKGFAIVQTIWENYSLIKRTHQVVHMCCQCNQEDRYRQSSHPLPNRSHHSDKGLNSMGHLRREHYVIYNTMGYSHNLIKEHTVLLN